jgi:hypothetical protein
LLVLLLLTGCPFNHTTRLQRAAAAAAPLECYPSTPGLQQTHLHCVHPRHIAAGDLLCEVVADLLAFMLCRLLVDQFLFVYCIFDAF